MEPRVISSEIIRTPFEYSVMKIQRYEFTCRECFITKTVADMSTQYSVCTDCK